MDEMIERVAKAISDARQVRGYGRVMTMWRSPEMSPNYIVERVADARVAVETVQGLQGVAGQGALK
jgi:hypothetical protein